MNERFTKFADLVTEAVGQWWFTCTSTLLLILWILYGAFIIGHSTHEWFVSAEFNFPLNTVTTVGEWFLEGFILAAANRVERRNAHLLACLLELVQKVDTVVEQEEQDLAKFLPDARQ